MKFKVTIKIRGNVTFNQHVSTTEHESLIFKSFCILSEHWDHDATGFFVFYCVQKFIISHIEKYLSKVECVIYFSNGCSRSVQ